MNKQDHRWEDYFWPNSTVLKNKLFLYDEQELHQKELELSFYRQVELMEHPIMGNFDEEHLKEIHAYLFQDVYDFAGQYRNVDIEKNTCGFVHYKDIPIRLHEIMSEIEDDLQSITSKDAFAEFLARLFVQIMYVHPFREGNGRAIREYIREIAVVKSQNFAFGPLDFLWSNVNKDVLNETIHFSTVFYSAITLEFSRALVPIERSHKLG